MLLILCSVLLIEGELPALPSTYVAPRLPRLTCTMVALSASMRSMSQPRWRFSLFTESLLIPFPPPQEVVALSAAAGYDPDEVEALFSEADTNKDSVISFDEFVQLMRHSYIS